MNEVLTVGADRDEIIARCKQDLNFFASICLPEVYEFPFPPTHLAVWQMLTDDALRPAGLHRLCLGLPRGFAKTLLLKLFACWLVFYTDRRFIIVVCNTATLGENFLADVCDILQAPNILRIFGDYRTAIEKDSQPLKKFTFRGRPITLAALGTGSSLRGLNIKFVRPDVILMDDMQSREEAESPAVSLSQLTWMLATLFKARNNRRCLFAFIGNMYPFPGSILKKLKHNPAWVSFICGAILADGNSIWPELRSVEDILDELENDISMGHPEIFYSEVMNDEEAGNRAGIDISKIQVVNDDTFKYGELPAEAEAGFIIIDPAVGKKKNDQVAIGGYWIFDEVPVMWDLKVGAFNPLEQVREALHMAVHLDVMCIVVEGVAYQATLCFWLEHFKKQLGLESIRILEIYPPVGAKTSRIINALKMLTADKRQLAIHERVKSQVVYQTVHFNPLKTRNADDILDLLAYPHQVIQEFGPQLARAINMEPNVTATFSEDMNLAF